MAAKYLSKSSGGHSGSTDISPPPTSGGSRESSASSITSSGSHRNRQLLKSYHHFAMHVFSNNKATQEAERLFLSAVREGDYERVENFLKRRNHEVVNIDMKDFSSGDTPLIVACRNGFTKVVQLLLKFGADTTLRNYDGETAVSVASVPIRKLLIESVERSGCSHRHLLQAAWQGNVAIVQKLLKEGKFLDINCENADGLTPLLLVTKDITVFEKVKSALKEYSPDGVVRVLLAQRADPTLSDSEGKTAMHYAAACPSATGHQITLMLMKDKELMVAQDENCVAPIHIASKHGQVDIVVALLDNGVDINSRGHAGSTPLHVSALAGQLRVANTLLDRGADVTLVDDRGNTPMDVAHSKKMRIKLKEAWAEVVQSRRGSTPALSPVKPPSRKDHRRHSSSEDTSPRDNEPPMSLTTNRVLQKLKDAHQALLNENQVLRDIDNGRFTPSSLTSSKMNLQNHSKRRSVSPSKAPAPPKTPRGGEDQTSLQSLGQKTRRSLSYDDRTSTSKVKGVKGHQKLSYRHSDPTGNRRFDKAALPVAVVGLDWDESVQDIRYGRVNQGQLLQQRGIPPTCDIPKRLAISSNPSLQQVTDICSGYLKRGSKPLPSNEDDSQQSLPEVSPARPVSGTYRSVFFEGNHINRTTPSPFMERLHGFLGTALPSPTNKIPEDVILDCDEERRKTLSVVSVDSPISPRRSTFANSPFTRSESSEVQPGSLQQRTGSVAATTFNIEMSRVNQLKDSSDSGQGSSRSTNSRASTISTPSPLLGDLEGSPSRHQAGLKRSLHVQSIDGDSGVHLPSLRRADRIPTLEDRKLEENVRRSDKIQTLEDRNFRLVNSHQRHNSEDAMSVVSVSSSITVKTADICGQRISLSHTLKEESEVGSSPEQSLKDPGKIKDYINSQMGIQKMKSAMPETEENRGINLGKIEQTGTDEMGFSPSTSEKVTGLGNVHSRNVTSSNLIKSNNLKDAVKHELIEDKGNRVVSKQTKVDTKSTEQLNQLHANNQGIDRKQEKNTANTKDCQNNDKLMINRSDKQQSIDKNIEGKGHIAGSQQTTQLKKINEVNKRKKIAENKMENLPTEERITQRGDSVSNSDQSGKEKTINDKEESDKASCMKTNKKIQETFGSKDGNDSLLKVVPNVQKPSQTAGITEKKEQGKESLQKVNLKTPSLTKQSEKTNNSGIDKRAIEHRKTGESGMAGKNKLPSQKNITGQSTALKKNGHTSQSGGTDLVETTVQHELSSNSAPLVKSGFKGGVTHIKGESSDSKDLTKKGTASKGEGKDVKVSSEKSKIPLRQESKKGNVPVNISKQNDPRLSQQNTKQNEPRVSQQNIPVNKTKQNEPRVSQQNIPINTTKQNEPRVSQQNTKQNEPRLSQQNIPVNKTKQNEPRVSQQNTKQNEPRVSQQNIPVNKTKQNQPRVSQQNTKHNEPRVSQQNIPVNKTKQNELRVSQQNTKQNAPKVSQQNIPINTTNQNEPRVSQQNTKQNEPRVSQQNSPRGRIIPLPKAKTTGKKKESIRKTVTAAGTPTIKHTTEERKTNSGKSQGTGSTPTDVTSDLTSDLNSGDSDSIDSIEEILDEVAFSSSSDSEQDESAEMSTGSKPANNKPIVTMGDVKPGATMLDPAVIVTKCEDNGLKKKSASFSPKSPKTPKKGASSGTKKFVFKNVENSSGKRNSGKSVKAKKINTVKMNSSKVSTSNKLNQVQSKCQEKSTDTTTKTSSKETAKDSHSADDKEVISKVSASHQHTPVIIDIRDDLPECPAAVNVDNVRGSSSERSPKLKKTQNYPDKKKSTLQQLSQKISRGSLKTSSLMEKASNSVKSVNKNSKTSKINNSSKEAKVGKEGSKSQKKGKKTEVKGDLRILSDSESSNTAFITGQGWEIKTSCNESNGVIIQDGGTNSVKESLRSRKLSPANSLKIDFLARRTPMSPEVIKNIANIMSPLECNTPKFIPDTMDAIKEFAGSLSSVEEEKYKDIFTFSPVGSPKVTRNRKKVVKSPGKESSPGKSVSPLTQSPHTPESAFLPPPPTEDIPSLASDCKTNPDLLKVFCIPNHFESDTPRSSSPPSNEKENTLLDASLDKKQILADEMPRGAKEAIENRRKSINVMQKPPVSSKFGLSKSKRKSLKRRQSAPAELPSSDEDSSDADSCASSFKNRMRLLADISDVPSDDSSVDGRVSSRSRKNITGKKKVENREGEGEINNQVSDKDEDKLKSTSKEQLLTEHVQTISIKTLQELNSILSNSEEVNVTSPLAPPPLSSRPISRESSYSRSQISLNQSLPLSEGLDLSILDLRQESRLSGELTNTTGRGTTLSSATSGGDRSYSQSTNLSESEGELLHWKKGNILGKGAFGTVFCGLTNTGQLIAVKQVELTGKQQAGEQYEKLQEEVELLKTLRHKNIVGFLGVSLEESLVNIFMQYIPGGSIASLLARFGALEEAVFCRYTHQVVEGTVYLHSNNVIHRDIKGANIMLMSNGVIKLIDFGCAKRLCIQISQSQNLLKSMKGTPYWMAPEVIMETGHGTKSDVWSIGCTVMEMATRKPPWADMPPMSAIFAIGSGGPVPQLADKFSTAARGFVDQCLTRNPDDRFTSLELLQHPFLKQRQERRKDSRLHSRSSLSNFEEGIMFKEQPILKDTYENSRNKRIFEDFK